MLFHRRSAGTDQVAVADVPDQILGYTQHNGSQEARPAEHHRLREVESVVIRELSCEQAHDSGAQRHHVLAERLDQ